MTSLSRRAVCAICAAVPLVYWRGASAQAAVAPPAEVANAIESAALQGSATLRFLGLEIYRARLWTGARRASAAAWSGIPLALDLTYARSLQGGLIAERSLLEMRRQGAIDDALAARWLAEMKTLFPDVERGDRLTALNLPGTAELRVFSNGVARGVVSDSELARRFIGIWLSAQTSEPALRAALLGAGGT